MSESDIETGSLWRWNETGGVYAVEGVAAGRVSYSSPGGYEDSCSLDVFMRNFSPAHPKPAPAEPSREAIKVGSRWRNKATGRECTLAYVTRPIHHWQGRACIDYCDGGRDWGWLNHDEILRDFDFVAPAPRETPAHYESDVEPLVAIRAWGLNFALGCVVKHVARAGRKGPRIDDLIKARAYLDDEIAAEKEAAK